MLSFTREQLLRLNEHNVTQSIWHRMFTSEITEMTKVKRQVPQYASFGLLNARSVGNKSTAIASLIKEGAYDVFLVTETWHTASDDTALQRCVPADYVCLDTPRPSIEVSMINHGGVAAFVSENQAWKLIRPRFHLSKNVRVDVLLCQRGRQHDRRAVHLLTGVSSGERRILRLARHVSESHRST